MNVDAVADALTNADGVLSLDDLHIWALDAGKPVLTAVVVVEAERTDEATACIDGLHRMLASRFEIHHATIELRASNAPRRQDRH